MRKKIVVFAVPISFPILDSRATEEEEAEKRDFFLIFQIFFNYK
jgi:hypothetical protein